jgi:hypothetical protein
MDHSIHDNPTGIVTKLMKNFESLPCHSLGSDFVI